MDTLAGETDALPSQRNAAPQDPPSNDIEGRTGARTTKLYKSVTAWTLWIAPEALAAWHAPQAGRRGRSLHYSAEARQARPPDLTQAPFVQRSQQRRFAPLSSVACLSCSLCEVALL